MSDAKKEKMTFRQWVENYWYHYKWATLVGVFLFFFVLVSVVQCVTRVQPDVLVMYSGPKSLSFDQISQLKSSIISVMPDDYNGDGNRYVEYIENVILFDDYETTNEAGETEVLINRSEQVESYVTHVVAGDAQIYLVSPEVYRELSQQGVLTPLSELLGKTPVEAYDSASFRLGDLPIYQLPGLNQLPEDTLLCLRITKTIGVHDKQLAASEHAWASDLFCAMIAYTN